LGRAVFDAAAERSFEVEVMRFGTTYRSDVYVRDAAGKAIGHRSLQSDEPGCTALLNATALAIALVIDPEAAAREPPPNKAVAAFEAPVAAVPPPAAPSPPPPIAAAPSPPPAELRLPAAPERTPVTLSVRAQLVAGLVAATSPGFELSFNARPGQSWGFALAASYALSQTATSGSGSLDVGLTRASALVTFEAGRSQYVRLLLGAGPSVGAFHIAVRRPAPVTDPGDYWFASVELNADLQVAVSRSIFLDLGGAAFVPLRRQEFLIVGQSDPIWRQPFLSAVGFLGIGALFP
jgi:hypothetical protein